MRDNHLFWGGYALASGWIALVRAEGRPAATAVLRLFVAVGVPFLASFLLWGAMTADQSIGALLFLVALAVPLVVASYLFGALRNAVGIPVYLGALVVASAAYVTAFSIYLRS
jgi:hypothetical protein